MSGKIFLPNPAFVTRWKEDTVIKWLRKVHLDDCIPAFEARSINGEKLLDLTEQKLFTYQDLKIKHRKQIAKCVQECKSQASNAKKIAKSFKNSRRSQSEGTQSNGTNEWEYDSDDWGSEFEDCSDGEVTNEQAPVEVNNNTIQSLAAILERNLNSSHPLRSDKSIPQPPDVPLISNPKSIKSAGLKKAVSTGSISRHPIKRPSSQPPPPPFLQVSPQPENQDDYEVPITSSSSSIKDNCSFSDTSSLSSRSNEIPSLETYEIIEPSEANYEIVEPPKSEAKMSEKPVLPPRILPSPSGLTAPPLPQKPQKFSTALKPENRVRTFTRPKPPIKPNVGCSDANQSTINEAGFVNSLPRKRSAGDLLPKWPSENKNGIEISGPILYPDSQKFSSLSLSPQKSSIFEEIGSVSNMASRPLPPVPVATEQNHSNNVQDIQKCPWFQEIDRDEAESLIRTINESGAFVVRPSKRAGKENPYSVTVLHEGRMFHLNIRQRNDNTFALGKEKEKEKTFPSVIELITFHLKEPILLKNRGVPAGTTILMKYPPKD